MGREMAGRGRSQGNPPDKNCSGRGGDGGQGWVSVKSGGLEIRG
jgi:hypothetical protein